ncbi:MAG TPA: GerMN domain-containing protein [Candidatus Limnocylindrales bacterium]|nr:GerMN domain-containing protein [Candidatus Limnocylindrales bacterium]
MKLFWIAAVLMVAGCGVPIEEEARALPSQSAHVPSSATPAPIQTGPVTETLYLVKGGLLIAVPRKHRTEPGVDEVMAELLAGPTEAEKAAGIGSALLGSKVVAAVQVQNGTAVVELAANLEGTGRTDDVLAIGQIVCTLTARPDISWATFTRDGRPIEVPRGDGSLTADPLNAASYSRLIVVG